MSARSARASRAQRHREALLRREVDAAFEEMNRQELLDIRLQVDERLGGMVDLLVEDDRRANAAEGARVRNMYNILTQCERTTPVTTSDGMVPWSQAKTARRVATSEVALALRMPEQTVATRLEEARDLVEKLPRTMAALLVGDFSYRYAAGILDIARTLPDDNWFEFEIKVLRYATKLTFSKFKQRARAVAAKIDAASLKEKHEKSFADRHTVFEPDANGMGWLQLYTSAHLGIAAVNRANEMADVAAAQPGEDRTLTQLRADMMTDLLLDGTIEGRSETSIRPSVNITVPLKSMLGLKTDGEVELPTLEGYGPIDISTARRLAAASKSWLSVFTTPDGSAITSVGHQRRVPSALRTLLQLIDGTCRKPGCTRPAYQGDLDHTEEFQHGGMTAHDNLEHLCKKHHAEKHHTNELVEHLPNGDIRWTMPSGRSYISEPGFRYAPLRDGTQPPE